MEYQLNVIICLLRQIQQQIADNILDIIQCVLGIIACVLAWLIPKKIMWEQTYANLTVEYRSFDFGAAIQGIVEFFIIDCNANIENITKEYERRFVKDVYGLDLDNDLHGKFTPEKVRELLQQENTKGTRNSRDDKQSPCLNQKSPELCLHYQRRLLAQFYYQLDLCACSRFIGKRRVRRDFTYKESNIVRLLFLMDDAVAESDILKKDTSCDFRVPRNVKDMNRHLADIYYVLKKSKPYMEA